MKLEDIPYLTHVPQDGRALLFQPWYDVTSGQWQMYFAIGADDYILGQVRGMSAGIYYAREAAAHNDIEFPLGTLIAQHLSFPGVAAAFYPLVDDVQLLSASLEKLELIGASVADHSLASFLVQTELEYMFILLRAMYDLLQKIAKRVWKHLCKADGTPAIAELPDSFNDVVSAGGRPRTASELTAKYCLPDPLAAFYVRESALFILVREIRVSVEHHGRRLPSVFLTERGLGISTEGDAPWASLGVWARHEPLNNGIGSVRALAAFLAKSFLDTLKAFAQALSSIISPSLLPPAVSAGNKIYLTNPAIYRFSGLEATIASPWNSNSLATEETA